MLAGEEFARLAAIVAAGKDAGGALQALAEAAHRLTDSRNAFFVLLDREAGTMHFRYGTGADWHHVASVEDRAIQAEQVEGIVAVVATSGESVRSGDVRTDPRYRELFANSRSELAIAVRDPFGRVQAVLNLESDQPDHYSREHESIATALAHLAAVVVQVEENRRREDALIEIGQAVHRIEDEDSLVARIVAVADEVLEFHSLSVFLLDSARERYVLRANAGALRSQVGQASYEAGEGLTGWVCSEGVPLLIHSPQSDPRWRGRFLDFPSDVIESYLAVPILVRGRSLGALRVLRCQNPNPIYDGRFTEADQRLLETIADQLAGGLEGLRMVDKALRAERMAAWGEMSAKSSHMIGNRVFALKGDVNELRHLLEEATLDVGALRALQVRLAVNITRVDELLQEFRDYVSASQVRLVEGDLDQLVGEAVREVFPRRTGVELVLELGCTDPVRVDARKLRRAVTEIVENSLSFFDHGTLAVRTRRASAADLRATRYRGRDPMAAIEIEDQGPGVPEGLKETIFQPFYSSRVKGMGLGLSIVRGILEGHGGVVVEAGEEGSGARFVMLIPLAARP